MTKFTYVSANERVKITSTFFYVSAKFQVRNKFKRWVTKMRRYYQPGLIINPSDEVIRAYRTTSNRAGTKITTIPTFPGLPSPAAS